MIGWEGWQEGVVQDHPPNVETMDCVMQEICCVDFSGFTKLGPSDRLKVNLSKTTNWKRQTEQPPGTNGTQPNLGQRANWRF